MIEYVEKARTPRRAGESHVSRSAKGVPKFQKPFSSSEFCHPGGSVAFRTDTCISLMRNVLYVRHASYAILFAAVSVTCPMLAQSVDTGSLGTATGASVRRCPGATLTISSDHRVQPVGGDWGSRDYSIKYLMPREYDIRVVAAGFSTQTEKELVLQLGQPDKLDSPCQRDQTRWCRYKGRSRCCRAKMQNRVR